MSSLPPPPPADSSPPAGLPPQGPYTPAPVTPPPTGAPPPRRNRRTAALVGAFAVVAAVSGGGVYLLTRDDGGDGRSESTTTERVSTTRPATTEPTTEPTEPRTTPATTTPDTTEPDVTEPSTTVAPTTTPFVLPEGAIDLGYQVYLPLAEGWERRDDSDLVVVTDGTTRISVQVIVRDADEDPMVLVQDWADLYEDDFAAIAYSPTVHRGMLDRGVVPAEYFFTYYDTLDEDGSGIGGNLASYHRADGLSALYDIYTWDATADTAYPDDAFDEFLDSFLAAPVLGPTVELGPRSPQRVTSSHPFVEIEDLVGFTLAPGFHTMAEGDGEAYVTNDVEDFQVIVLSGQSDADAVVAAAEAYLSDTYPDAAFGDPESESDDQGLVQVIVRWSGTYLGSPVDGVFDGRFDPETGDAMVLFRHWYASAGADGEPYAAEAQFMYSAAFHCFVALR